MRHQKTGWSPAIMRTGALLVAVLAACGNCMADGSSSSCTSDRAFLILHTGESAFWSTATNSTVTLPVVFPKGASSATLQVTGVGYSETCPGITSDSFDLVLPAATEERQENVYDLTLTFDDGTVRSARFAVTVGATDGNEGGVPCRLGYGTPSWQRAVKKAVIPLPQGTASLSVDGNTVYSDAEGAQGWYALGPLTRRVRYSLTLTDQGGAEQTADIVGSSEVFSIILK